MRRLPLDVTMVRRSADVLLLLVVEDQPVVLMRQTLDVLMHHEFRDVELGTCQPEEILQPQLDPVLLHTQHRVAMQEVHDAVQPLPQLQLADVPTQMDEGVEDEEAYMPVGLFYQLAVQDLYHLPFLPIHLCRGRLEEMGNGNIC
jgi:hypothetical protein